MPLIDVNELTACYPGATQPIVKNQTWSIQKGEMLTILGPNGAGKSTLLRCLSALLRPSQGQVRVAGDDVQQLEPRERARRLALVSQSEATAFALSVHEIVLTGRAAHLNLFERPGAHDHQLTREAIDAMGIAHLAQRSFSELSGGERQLARIARALVQQSAVLLLDEPTAHLDLANQLQVLKAILQLLQKGCTVVMTSHDPAHALLCEGKALLLGKDGSHAFGRAADVLSDERLSQLYGVPLSLMRLPTGPAVAPHYSALLRS